MIEDGFLNPGIPPIPKVPEYGSDHPRLGAGEEAEATKPFSLPPEPGKKAETTSEKPTPMELARDNAHQTPQLSPEQLGENIEKLRNGLGDVKDKLQNESITRKFVEDHHEALGRNVNLMTPDVHAIAKHSGQEYKPTQQVPGEGVLKYVTRWLDGTQDTLRGALNYVTEEKSVDPTSFLKLQYAVQRASQRGELFASIVGSSVSGIKTLMSTQLG